MSMDDVSTAGTTTINVVSAAVETDPFNPGQTALFVGGTTGKDTVNLRRVRQPNCRNLEQGRRGDFQHQRAADRLRPRGRGRHQVGAGVTNTVICWKLPRTNVETDLDNEAIQWAGLSAAVEILNE